MTGRKPSHLESIVEAAEALAAQRSITPPDEPTGPVRDELERMAGVAAARLGLEELRIGELNRHHDEAVRRAAEEARHRTADDDAGRARRLGAVVESRRQALSDHPDLLGPDTQLLLSVDFIRSWADPDNLIQSRQQPGLNWAKYRVTQEHGAIRGTGTQKVSFYNAWHNPHIRDVLIDVEVRMTVNGHLGAHADGGGVGSWFFPNSRASADVSARLTLWQLWSDPAPQLVVDTRPVGSVSAEGGFLGDGAGASVSDAPAVSAHGFWVRGGSDILIEASVVVDYEVLDGEVTADFATDDLASVGWAYATVTVPSSG